MAGDQLGSLYYDLNIDGKNLDKQLDGADKKVKEFGANVSDSGEKLKAGLNKAAIGFAAAGAGLTLISKNATDFTVNLVKDSKNLARQIGTTTEEASRLTAALGRLGISSEQASMSFGIFAKQIVKSTENAGATADAFSKLGISTRDAQGHQKDFNTLLFETADAFKAMPNGVDKTALSMELFGRQGKDMIKVLNLGADGIQELEKQADKLGLTLTSKTIGAVNEYIKSQKDLKESTDAMKIAIGTATAPYLTKFNETLNQVVLKLLDAPAPIREATTAFLAFGGPVFAATGAVLALAANLVQVWPEIVKVTQAVKEWTAAQLALDTALWANPIALLILAIIAIGVAIAEAIIHFNELGAIVVTVMDTIGMALKGVWQWIVNNWPLLLAILFGPFGLAVYMIKQNWQTILDFFAGIPAAIGGFVAGVAGTILAPFKSAFNAVVSAWNNTVGKISFKAPSWVPGFGGKGWSMPKFAKGGIATSPTVGMFGEAGTEAVLPLSYLNRYNNLFDRIENMATGKGDTTINGGRTIVNIGNIEDRQDADYIIRRLDRNSELEGMGLSPA